MSPSALLLLCAAAAVACWAIWRLGAAAPRARRAAAEVEAAGAGGGRDDHAFLLDVCAGDGAEVLRRLEAEVRRNPGIDDAQAYRRAIRSWFLEHRGGTHGEVGGESRGGDVWL